MTVRQAQTQINAAEFAEWRAYYQLDPFGGVRGDLNTATIATLLNNVYGGKAELLDFIPRFDKQESELDEGQSVEQMQSVLFMAAKLNESKNGNNCKPGCELDG